MRKTQLTVHVEPRTAAQIHERGAGGERGVGEVVRRRLEILDSLVVHSDPRATRGFPDAFFDFLVSFLTEPWTIPADRIVRLEAYVAQQPGFADAVAKAGIDPAELRAAIRVLTFAERLAILDAAEVQHAREFPPRMPSPKRRR